MADLAEADRALLEKVQPSKPLYHICTGKHPVGACVPGCTSYCGAVYSGGGTPGGTRQRAPMDVCVICQVERTG